MHWPSSLKESSLVLDITKERMKRNKANLNFRAQLFERRLALTRVSFFLLYKVFSQIIFSILFKVSDHQIVGRKN